IAVFMSTPSQPSSIAMAASDAVPTPASTMTGTVTASRMSLRLYGLRMPSPEPMGAPSGITAAAPASSSFLHMMGSSLVYGSTVQPSLASVAGASRSPMTSGNSVRESPMTSSLTMLPRPASRARHH